MPRYYVYVIQCEGDSYYTGYTRNVKSRFTRHTKGKGARYTRIHRPKDLAYVEEFSTRSDAMKREKRIKTLSHAQKTKLIHDHAKTTRQAMRNRKR